MENNLLKPTQGKPALKNKQLLLLIALAVLCLPLGVPLLITLGSLLFAFGLTFATLLGTGIALLVKSFSFLVSLEMVFFAKSFLGGLSLLALCLVPVLLVGLPIGYSIHKKTNKQEVR